MIVLILLCLFVAMLMCCVANEHQTRTLRRHTLTVIVLVFLDLLFAV